MLTTIQKIILAFTVTILVMATLAFLGYRGLTQASTGYQETNRLVSMDMATTDAMRFLNNTAYLSTRYLRTGNPRDMEDGLAALQEALERVTVAKASSQIPATINALDAIEESALQFRQNLANLQEHRSNAMSIFASTMRPAVIAFGQQINMMAAMEHEVQNSDALNGIALLWPTLSRLDTALARYIETQEQLEGETSEKGLIQLEELAKALEPHLFTDRALDAYKDLMLLYQDITNAFETLRPIIASSRTSNMNRAKTLHETRALIEELDAVVTPLRESRRVAFETSSDATITQTMTVTTVGLLITFAFAIFIILSITSTFKKLSTYFVQIAKGDFNAQSGITEKGAIGIMLEGMQEIPDTLNAIIKSTNDTAQDIMAGHFRNRFDTSAYSGGFSDLGTSINSLANVYTNVIDSIPTPMSACSTDHTIFFLNKPAQDMLGGDKVNQNCADAFKADVCRTGDCYGDSCIRSNSMSSGITCVALGNKRNDITAMATPLRDTQGNAIGYLEIITDITDIKDQERLILKTATEAADIADRVASATEELSAQVEQTSRGTDEQKRQVESTASAMHEMNSTVLEVARNTGQTSVQTEKTLEKAHQGAQLVDQVVHSINTVNNVATTLQNNMQVLGTQADNIGSVMNVISDIADQTNLLALNAAIEAARAGDAGRGFAVVADEVRKLAEKTMHATHEVGQSISTIQNSIRMNILEVTNAVESVSQATGLANSSGQALNEIVELVTSNSELVSSIATGAEQQSATSEEINRSIGEINMVVTEISSSMIQSSQAVGELSNMAQELRSLMEQLR